MKSRLVFSVIMLLLMSSTAFGQTTEILKMVPEDALGFAVVNRLDQTDKQLTLLVQKMNIPIPGSPLALLKQSLGVNKGLNEKGTVAMVFLPGQAGFGAPIAIPEVVVAVPVSNYKTFLQGLGAKEGKGKIAEAQLLTGQNVLIAKGKSFRGSFALVAITDHRAALEKVLKSKKGLAKDLQPLQKWLTESDAAAVVISPGIKLIVETVQMGINQGRQFLDPTNEDQKVLFHVMDLYENMFKSIGKNMTHFALGTRLKEAGNVRISMRGGFRAGGGWAKAIKGYTAKASPLAGLPGGPFVFAFGMAMPDSFQDGFVELAKLGFQLDKEKKLSPQEQKDMMKILRKMYDIDAMSMLIAAPGNKGKTLMENVVAQLKVANARKYLKFYAKNVEKLSKATEKFNPKNSTKVISVKRVKDSKVPAVEIVQKYQITDPQQQQIYEAILGKNATITSTLAAVDDKTILITMSPAKNLPKYLKMYHNKKSSLASQPTVKKLLARLPKGSQTIMLFDAGPVVKYIKDIGGNFDPNLKNLPVFPQSPPLGFGMRLEPSGMDAEIIIPLPLIENAGAYFRKLQALQGV